MQVEITRFARTQLRKIHTYYKIKASERIALQIIDKLLDAVEELGALPSIGTVEPNLTHSQLHYKFIVCGNYKIIFRTTKDIIYVTDIFNCRQDPRKIIKRNR
jgi:toxin ParE1/3/4